MEGARGDALDWALALAKAPGERHALRQRPLPDGIGELLAIAAGSQDALARSAEHCGETPQHVLDAVRFYLREILFFHGADAYRNLGLTRGASGDEIKSHHRLLQQWLHPDRGGGELDEPFAAKVNVAWNQLRTEERRREYRAPDDEAAIDEQALAGDWASPRVWATPEPIAVPASERWRRRAPLVLLLIGCVALGILAMRDASRGADWVDSGEFAPKEQEAELPLLRLPSLAREPETTPARSQRSAEPQSRQGPETSPVLEEALAVAFDAGTVETAGDDSEAPVPPIQGKATLPSPETSTGVVPIAQAPKAEPVPASIAAPAVAARPPAAPARPPEAAPDPSPAQQVTGQQVQQAQRVGQSLLEYMIGRGGKVPPIWNHLDAQRGAQHIRAGMQDTPPTRIGDPQWRIGAAQATVDAPLTFQDGLAGRLSASMVWRNEQWLIDSLSMERDW